VQPLHGLVFRTEGHYGSAVFDSSDIQPTYLEVVICDDCMRKLSKNNLVYHVLPRRAPPPSSQYLLWDPDIKDPEEDDEDGLAAQVPERNRSTWRP
jgi:hypothetical protein